MKEYSVIEVEIGDKVIVGNYALADELNVKLPKEVVITGICEDGILFKENDIEYFVETEHLFLNWKEYSLWNQMKHN